MFADDWIRTADLFQLSHNHCPIIIVSCVRGKSGVKIECLGRNLLLEREREGECLSEMLIFTYGGLLKCLSPRLVE